VREMRSVLPYGGPHSREWPRCHLKRKGRAQGISPSPSSSGKRSVPKASTIPLIIVELSTLGGNPETARIMGEVITAVIQRRVSLTGSVPWELNGRYDGE
jgi:hypothetical protein